MIDSINIIKANDEQLSGIVRLLEEYLENPPNITAMKVAHRFLGRLKGIGRYPKMFVHIAESERGVLGISGGDFDGIYGIAYHVVCFERGQGIGKLLFERKMDQIFSKVKVMVAKPESYAGLQLIKGYGFEPEPSLNHLLYWEGTSYTLKK